MSKHIIFGAPGTGKTTFLMKTLEELFNKGYKPEDICFSTYSCSAAEEAKERAMLRFSIEKKDIPFFGTIHSICFRAFNFEREVMTSKDKTIFFDSEKIDYRVVETDEDLLTNEDNIEIEGNVLLNFYDKLRLFFSRNISDFQEKDLKKAFFSLPLNEKEYEKIFCSYFNPYDVLVRYEKFKEKNNLIDFIDMLLFALKNNFIVPTRVLIIDEFQDLSPLQYEIYKLWSKDKEEVYIAGDDDQTIYKFICANPKFLLDEKTTLDKEKGDEEIILPLTYRLPSEIHNYCQEYAKKNIKKRVYKEVKPKNSGGEVIIEHLDGDLEKVLDFIRKDKFTFILFRTNYQKRVFIEEVLIPNGVVYYEIKGQSIWNNKTINLFNASYKILNNIPLTFEEVKYLISSISFKKGLFLRGLKENFINIEKKEFYTKEDLIKIGFSFELFSLDNYEKIFSILDIGEGIKRSFKNREKIPIEFPIKLKIGTIHSSKGKEADDVILFKDISLSLSKKIFSGFHDLKDRLEDEVRVFYVGMTRARERLVILRGGFARSDTEIIP